MQTPWTTTEFGDRPFGSSAEITESSCCLVGYVFNSQIWFLNCKLTVLCVTVFVLGMLKLCAVVQSSKQSKGAKIRNRYNQVPHLTQDTNWKVTNSQLDTTNESQEVDPFPAGDHKAQLNTHTHAHTHTQA